MKLRSLIWALAAVCVFGTTASAMKIQVKSNQQGLLSDGTGTPITGTVVVECRIYDAPAGGNLLYTEPAASVDITNGLFDLTLGNGAIPLSPDVFASDLDTGFVVRYLEFVVNGEALSRVEMVAAPFAVAAHRLAGDVQTMPGELLVEDPNEAGGILPCIRVATDLGGGEVGIHVMDTKPGATGGTDSSRAMLTCDASGGNSFTIDFNEQGGINPSVRVATDPISGSLLEVEGDVAGGIAPCVRVAADPAAGSSLNVELNQQSGISPCVRVAADPVTGGMLRVDGDVAGGIIPCVRIAADPSVGSSLNVELNQASGISPCIRLATDPTTGSLLQVDGDPAGGIAPCVRVATDPDLGSSSLEVELNQQSGIVPCVRVASDLSGALLTMSRSIAGAGVVPVRGGWGADAAAQDSVSIEMFVDADSARMQLYAGAAAFNTPIVMLADGNEASMGIGTSAPQAALDVVGDICLTGNVGACSDLRYKRDIHTIDGALDKISQIRGVDYEWRREEFESMRFAEGRQIGVIAQDVEAVLPELVQTRADDYKMVDYTKLTAVLIEAMKELKTENEDLRTRLEKLESSTGATATQ